MRTSLAALCLFSAMTTVASAETLRIDASAPTPAPVEGYLKMGQAVGPGGEIEINNRFLTRAGRPWIPVMGEFHYSRYPSAFWEQELLKMKAAGINTVASYIIWNQHELSPGSLDWTGDRNLRLFAQLCAKHGMNLYIRPGPWVHGETRFGGLPDWIVERSERRTNDPLYMAQVERFWTEIATQLNGLLWKDGGPVIGMQLENEYNLTGPGKGAEHIAALKALARKLGFDLPLYTVTGWDNAAYPRREVAPVDGAYVDEPWGTSTKTLSPREAYTFRFANSMATGLGAQTAGDSERVPDAIKDRPFTPYLGAEFGSGLPVMYRRRPVVDPEDVAATILTQLGSGLNLLGYYMFHGGANPTANGRGLEENAREGAYNDVPKISYDFQAALGQYGEVNPVNGYLRPLHYFLDAFADRFAPTTLRKPERVPKGADDLSTPRVAVRSDGERGFVFMNNHVRNHAMAMQKSVRFDVALPNGRLTFPSRPIDVSSGNYFFLPFNFDLGGIDLAWATAQPITRVGTPESPLFIFSAVEGVPVEFAFAADIVSATGARSRLVDGRRIFDLTPSQKIVEVRDRNGRKVQLLVLSPEDSRRLWVLGGKAGKRAILSTASVFEEAGRVTLRQTGSPRFEMKTWPELPSAPGLRQTGASGGLFSYTGTMAAKTLGKIAVEQVRKPGTARPIDLFGPAGSAVQPAPEAHDAAGVWQFTVRPDVLQGLSDAWLTIDYRGDIARLFHGNTLLDDMFWDGRRWRIGLRRFADRLGKAWDLSILPLRKDAPIYLEEELKPDFGDKQQLAELLSVKIEPEYELNIGDTGR